MLVHHIIFSIQNPEWLSKNVIYIASIIQLDIH
uniref:Uncharacterized protein n=1 Tax=Anguilla anguilla TaxID=7936 RepID=A0A0E9SJU6_ANGAN